MNADKRGWKTNILSAFIRVVPQVRQTVSFVSIRARSWPIHQASAIGRTGVQVLGHECTRMDTNGHEWVTRARANCFISRGPKDDERALSCPMDGRETGHAGFIGGQFQMPVRPYLLLNFLEDSQLLGSFGGHAGRAVCAGQTVVVLGRLGFQSDRDFVFSDRVG